MHTLARIFLTFTLLVTALPHSAAAGENGQWSLGAAAAIGTSEYKGMDVQVLPFPLIKYEGERFFLRGLTGGLHLYKDDMQELSLQLSYLPQSFDASKSDHYSMRQLDDRYSTAMGGAGYRIKTPVGTGRANISGDLLGNNQGFLGDLAYLYNFDLAPVQITPGAGVMWASSSYNDYYYGVSGKESRKSGLHEYEAEDGWSPYVELSADCSLDENWHLFLNSRVTFLNGEVTDSPMVNEKSTTNMTTGVRYDF